MHCTSCGTALVEGAVFCKRCGTATAAAVVMRAAPSAPSDKLAELTICFAVMTGVVSLGGLLSAAVLVFKLLTRGIHPGPAISLALLCLAATVALAWLLSRQTTRVLDAYLRPYSRTDAPAEPPARDTAQLEAPREPATSVTDHTTRTFDPVYVEQSKRQ